MTWDPFGTLAQTLWIGGGQWAGKSTVSNAIAKKYGVTAYHCDYHSGRSHLDRQIAAASANGVAFIPPTAEHMYLDLTPAEAAAEALDILATAFECALDDLRALVAGRPIIAEGWMFRPQLVAPILPSRRQMIVMVPTDEFRLHQSVHLDRATRPHGPVSDLQRAQHNRLERDRLVAADAVEQARRLDIRVLQVDGSIGVDGLVDIVADHFAPYLG